MRHVKQFCMLMIIVMVFAASALSSTITTSLVASQQSPVKGETIEIPVIVDLSQMPEKLGSYTAMLSWNPQAFTFEGYSGGTTPGFEKPLVNAGSAEEGYLQFASANPYGGEGQVHILTVSLKVIGEQGRDYTLDINFTAMASAVTFRDLLPYWNKAVTSVKLNIAETPKSFKLEQNHPNPFNPSTEVGFQLPRDSHVKIHIYNLSGQLVKTLVDTEMRLGVHKVTWDGRNSSGEIVPSGVYVMVMQADDFRAERKLMLVK